MEFGFSATLFQHHESYVYVTFGTLQQKFLFLKIVFCWRVLTIFIAYRFNKVFNKIKYVPVCAENSQDF